MLICLSPENHRLLMSPLPGCPWGTDRGRLDGRLRDTGPHTAAAEWHDRCPAASRSCGLEVLWSVCALTFAATGRRLRFQGTELRDADETVPEGHLESAWFTATSDKLARLWGRAVYSRKTR